MTYWLAPARRVVLLTGFAKSRQVELAAKAGMTQSALSRLEGGGAVPTSPVFDRLAAAMGAEFTVAFESTAA